MNAIVYHRYGPPEVLHVAEVERPSPGPGEILVELQATEVTKTDCELRSFRFPVKWFWLPLRLMLGVRRPRRPILGSYFSGRVVELGAEASGFQVGDEVFGCASFEVGAYGEYACYPASHTILPKPRNMTFTEAAAVPLGGLNALHFMRRAKIQPGERVLVNGAGGSIGIHAVQIAKAMGAQVSVVDRDIKQEMLLRIGADQFIDYGQEDFSARGETYDVVFDMVAGSSFSKGIRVLNPGGRYLMGNPRVSRMIRALFTSLLTDKQVTFAFAGEHREELQTLKEMVEAGEIQPVVDQVYPPSQVAEAHRRVETEERLGMIVIDMKAF